MNEKEVQIPDSAESKEQGLTKDEIRYKGQKRD